MQRFPAKYRGNECETMNATEKDGVDSKYSHLNSIERINNLCVRCKMIIYIINVIHFIPIKITREIACKLKFQS